MTDIEKSIQSEQLLAKSIDSTSQAIKLLSHYIVKAETLNIEVLRNQLFIETLRGQLENLSHDIKKNYPEDLSIIIRSNKILENPDIKKASETIRDVRLAMGLMKLIAANITGFEGDPEMWYKFTDTVKRLDFENNSFP